LDVVWIVPEQVSTDAFCYLGMAVFHSGQRGLQARSPQRDIHRSASISRKRQYSL
jgi:hypothetical protein